MKLHNQFSVLSIVTIAWSIYIKDSFLGLAGIIIVCTAAILREIEILKDKEAGDE